MIKLADKNFPVRHTIFFLGTLPFRRSQKDMSAMLFHFSGRAFENELPPNTIDPIEKEGAASTDKCRVCVIGAGKFTLTLCPQIKVSGAAGLATARALLEVHAYHVL